MERDFKSEFIELKQNEIPDLWNRIEAGLSERKAVVSADKKINTAFKKISWRRWGTLAAACLCVTIIIPVLSLIIRNSSKNYSGGSMTGENTNGSMNENTSSGAAMDSATADCAPAEEMENSTPVLTEESERNGGDSWEGVLADTGNAADVVQGTMTQEKENEMEDLAGEADGVLETAKVNSEAENKNASKDLSFQKGQIIENVIMQIVESEISGEEVIYQAVVLEPDADALLQKDMQLEIVCTSDTEYDSLISAAEKELLKDSGNYEISLRFEQEKFVVIKCGISGLIKK